MRRRIGALLPQVRFRQFPRNEVLRPLRLVVDCVRPSTRRRLDGEPWLRRHSKAIAFAFSSIMIWSSTAITILTQQIEPLFLMIVLFLAGTGTFLSWGGRIQALLSIVAIVAFVTSIQKLSIEIDPYQ